ncbi:uncharacterized protein PGTG_20450 [Puccinia graminis f. sp. tritici CRL 75-36-700-3]|uniref:Helicase ATP-binding domain-containing protein n=1 Tax=Puccinia graminis f. sp. tritici (strain CRL 75-36-700-3 / race SCCL) TaxID=418459 RepID=E3NY45_PUCGT|nr:uncharacterized protein PGTG_20450 [Puccinia graminis f. sp. tritici CRL 75-36-700-3]EFP94494.2 hypothetical protein PGTG_20450 [Puccinia graminis f. sp. tritici CRL 75-36-700-3]
MAVVFCLGQILISFPSRTTISPPADVPQVVFLQRGNRRVHVLGAGGLSFGDLSEIQSRFVGQLLGPVGGCSTRMTEAKFSDLEESLIKLQAFVITKSSTHSQLRACVFSRSKDVQTVLSAFSGAGIDILPIWNYNQSLFFDIPLFTSSDHQHVQSENFRWLQPYLFQCKTKLKDHQLSALRFLKKNESEGDTISQVWNHSDNNWIRNNVGDWTEPPTSSEDRRPRGSILADDMGLGKTLNALMFILATSQLGVNFRHSNMDRTAATSAATLIICPLATLSNWENEIHIHFRAHTIPYCVFHGSNRKEIKYEQFLSSMVVLTTYEMIGTAGNTSTSRPMIENLNINWFRIVLDEAHMIRNRGSTRTQLIQRLRARFFLCLTGTPLQNRLTDLQSLVQLLRIQPYKIVKPAHGGNMLEEDKGCLVEPSAKDGTCRGSPS